VSGRPEGAGLELHELEVSIASSGADVVREVSFSVGPGEVLGLVGESGSGKTTVALALLGHARRGLTISNGQVLVDGVDLLGLQPAELRAMRGQKVTYVPQDPSAALNPALRVGTQLREALEGDKAGARDIGDRMTEVLAQTRLDAFPGLLRRYPHQLSGGQQQRLTLAMAFACRPSLIVLDEPTTGLDVTTQRHVLDTVRSLCRSYGVAAVYVSHDLAVVGGLAANVAVMYAGRVIERGTTQQVFGLPAHPYTRGLLAAIPAPDRAEVLHGIEGQPPRPGSRPRGCSFAPRCAFVVARCLTEAPAPELVDGRLVRCHRAAEITAEARLREPITPADDARPETSMLSVRDLDASYGPARVLSAIDIDVAPKACLAIVGESGSGKTTLAQCIVGLHKNWRGEVRLGSERLVPGAGKRSKETLRRIQYVFQNPYMSLNPRKTVGQIVSQPLEHFFGLSFADRSARTVQVLTEVALGPDFAERFPDQLSGGERQRVAIARALVVRPDLLICDEVTSALDVSAQAAIVELFRTLQRERQLTMIFITHNLALVRSIAQTVVVLRDGRIVERGSVDDVFARPKDPYTIRLMDDVPQVDLRP
jgi:peptide/nickel transport system ATP-binding protein